MSDKLAACRGQESVFSLWPWVFETFYLKFKLKGEGRRVNGGKPRLDEASRGFRIEELTGRSKLGGITEGMEFVSTNRRYDCFGYYRCGLCCNHRCHIDHDNSGHTHHLCFAVQIESVTTQTRCAN